MFVVGSERVVGNWEVNFWIAPSLASWVGIPVASIFCEASPRDTSEHPRPSPYFTFLMYLPLYGAVGSCLASAYWNSCSGPGIFS
jgi:hypothetical protein